MEFNLKKSRIWQALKWERVFNFIIFSKKLFFVLFIIVFLLFLYAFIPQNFNTETQKLLLGLSTIFLFITIGSLYKERFFNNLKNPKVKYMIEQAILNPDQYNLAEFLNFEVAKSIWKTIKFCKKKNISPIPSEVLLYFLLDKKEQTNFIFSRGLLGLDEFRKELKAHINNIKKEQFKQVFSFDSEKVILNSLKIAQKKGRNRIKIQDIILSQSQINEIFKKKLIEKDLKQEDIEYLADWLSSLEKKILDGKKWWSWKNLIKKGSLAKEWTSGYTITLDKYAKNFTEIIKDAGFKEIIGNKKEIKNVERILSRTKINNVLLIGEPGTGREAIIESIAQKSLLGESLPDINNKRVVELDLPSLIAGIENTEEMESILNNIFEEVLLAGNVILVINNFHNFVGGQVGPGIVNIMGIISSYLEFPQFQVIGISSYQGLHKYIEQSPSLLNLFTKVEVSETSEKETLEILENEALLLEQKYNVFISYPALKTIYSFSDKYFRNIPFPKKALDLLDEVLVYVSTILKEKIVLPSHVAKIVSQKAEMPVGKLEEKEKETLLNLENLIHKRIINQKEAVKEVSTALRRARTQIGIRRGPMGTFLFLGPTGVGKTETSKTLSAIYFGSKDKTIRLDMSEFQNIKDISRLIGSKEQQGLLTTKIRENPFSLILLDEIEKSHPNILNLFLQVLDEGYITDGLGRKVDFKNSIIIATSNAGYRIILKALEERTEWSKVKEKLLTFLFEKGIFRPEFINRFDAVVVFGPLSKENLLDISELMLKKLQKNLKEKAIELVITDILKKNIVGLSYDPRFGAREMRRVIQDKIENVLAKAILSNELKKGDRVEIDSQFKLIIN